ncbi:hypothetical protein BU26DRAFT_573107 [Trematosphaeria pertusa]|uniref:Uncharacterized protein n=1 Tax=Trematosphaeria pertusa TaxID=390896 RepID=A0A6A6IYI7_9PLEO|nr:uncharacterized protein BU26DRAFT_573107 [Trematosphaeria pertusa]KAF2255484.1 hypothetical protein BU26DRAFT_573107 [Trematosphaeria pertusa]
MSSSQAKPHPSNGVANPRFQTYHSGYGSSIPVQPTSPRIEVRAILEPDLATPPRTLPPRIFLPVVLSLYLGVVDYLVERTLGRTICIGSASAPETICVVYANLCDSSKRQPPCTSTRSLPRVLVLQDVRHSDSTNWRGLAEIGSMPVGDEGSSCRSCSVGRRRSAETFFRGGWVPVENGSGSLWRDGLENAQFPGDNGDGGAVNVGISIELRSARMVPYSTIFPPPARYNTVKFIALGLGKSLLNVMKYPVLTMACAPVT